MQHFEVRSLRRSFKAVYLLRLSAVQCISVGLVGLGLPTAALAADSTFRSNSGDYRSCVAGITDTGVAAADAAAACAAALMPTDLSSCVVRIDSRTELSADDALENCRRVRRPVELSTCVVDISAIDNPTEAEPLRNVVDHCRRSLLPERFSACVVGLKSQEDYETTAAMTDCISATNRPRDVLPNFVPGNTTPTSPPTVPTQPLQPTQPTEPVQPTEPMQPMQPIPEQPAQPMPEAPAPK